MAEGQSNNRSATMSFELKKLSLDKVCDAFFKDSQNFLQYRHYRNASRYGMGNSNTNCIKRINLEITVSV